MKSEISIFLVATVFITIISCKKDSNSSPTPNPPPPPPPPVVDTPKTLKDAAVFPIGIAIEYALFKNNAAYRNTVVREADQVTFGYQMKHGAIVKDDGSFDYSAADELLTLSNASGLEVYGHTLVWHSNQNGNYLRSLLISNGSTSSTNLLPSGEFEAGTGTTGTGSSLFTGWNLLIGGTAAGSYAAVTGNNSSRALEATVTIAGANAYDMQAIGSGWTAVAGTQYKVSLDIKASVSGGKVRLLNQNSQYQQFDVTPTTSWASYSWTLTAVESSPILRLN